jgi:hypothetical protein
VDRAVAGDDAVAEEALVLETDGAVGDEPVQLHEAARIQQQVEALARRQLASLVLGTDPVRAATLLGLATQFLQPLQLLRDHCVQFTGTMRPA